MESAFDERDCDNTAFLLHYGELFFLPIMKSKPMTRTLYLTPDEKKVFLGLPAALREGWKMVEETLDCYEDEAELRTRSDLFRVNDPRFQDLLKKLQATKGNVTLQDVTDIGAKIPHEMMMSMFFTLGAGFFRDALTGVLPVVANDQDLEGAALLSELRHKLLEANMVTAN